MAAVKFRGLDPRTGLARWGLVAVAIGITVGATAPAAARGLALVVDSNPQSLVWLFERLFAWLAYIALAGSVIYGLLLSTKLLDAIAHRPINFSLHQDLAAFGLGLAGIHGMLLALDHSVPFTFGQILVPGLAPHAPVAVAYGQVALYLMAAVTASFYLRKRIGQRAWRTFHYVTFLAFAGATIHGIASGSDSNAPWAEAIYLASAALVLFLLTYRIGVSMATRAEARDRAAADALPLGGGRSDSFPAAAQRAAAIADVRVGSSYLPVSDDAPGARSLGSSRPSPVRDSGQVRRNAMG